MVEITCRDCGSKGDEAPDDPAPGLCPSCYDSRLAQITDKFAGMCASLDHPLMISLWLEEALIDIGGETPEAAHEHAATLFSSMSVLTEM
jgi:hypothetical protein